MKSAIKLVAFIGLFLAAEFLVSAQNLDCDPCIDRSAVRIKSFYGTFPLLNVIVGVSNDVSCAHGLTLRFFSGRSTR